MRPCCLAAALLLPMAAAPLGAHAAGTLRFGLDADLDTLDPARSGSYIERAVNASRCDQLLNIDPALIIVPELATAWEWSDDRLALTLHLREGVRFQDGAPLDAAAVRANLDRYRSAPYSFRRNELKPITDIEAVDALTVRIRLSAPYAPLLANRSGTMLSPRVLDAALDAGAAAPDEAGRIAAYRRAGDLWMADLACLPLYHFTWFWGLSRKVEGFTPRPDGLVRPVGLSLRP